ncbi:MAG TPA: hypothetical protein VNA28_06280 [Solirubrobacteraceae bacterium]|nr:hypothetical protein [Solirubrobacteraceae bacterium]
MTTRRLLCATFACLTLAIISLLLAREPVYDAWSWLVWGRELAHLQLDTTSGPAWKPLPVLLAAVLSLAGDAAPHLWLVLVRAAWLMGLVSAAQISLTLTAGRPRGPRIAGAAFAVLCIVLLADDVTHWSRQVAGGMAEPLLVALVLGATWAALIGRTRTALVLGALASLTRPEIFVPLALYGLWCWRTQSVRPVRPIRPSTRALVLGAVLVVPALWLLPDLVADGPRGSAQRAQTDTGDPLEALGWAVMAPAAVAWPLALGAALLDRRARVLGAGALVLVAIVAAMTVAGFAGLPRFMAPAAAIIAVLGGAGLASMLAQRRATWVVALVVPALAVTALTLPARVVDVPYDWRIAARIDGEHDRLRDVASSIGRERLLACGRLATSDVLARTALAWKLDVALSQVVSFGTRPRLSGAFVVGLQASPGLRHDVRTTATLVAENGEWSVYSIDCPATARPSPEARSAGVSGATR